LCCARSATTRPSTPPARAPAARRATWTRRCWLEVLLTRRDATQAQYALSDARWTGFASVLKLELATGQLAVRNFRPHYESAE
jgi:hypothetical protein